MRRLPLLFVGLLLTQNLRAFDLPQSALSPDFWGAAADRLGEPILTSNEVPDWVRTVTWQEAVQFAQSQVKTYAGKTVNYYRAGGNPFELVVAKDPNARLTAKKIRHQLKELPACEVELTSVSEFSDADTHQKLATHEQVIKMSLARLSLAGTDLYYIANPPPEDAAKFKTESFAQLIIKVQAASAVNFKINHKIALFVDPTNQATVGTPKTIEQQTDSAMGLVFLEATLANYLQGLRTARAFQVAAQLCGSN